MNQPAVTASWSLWEEVTGSDRMKNRSPDSYPLFIGITNVSLSFKMLSSILNVSRRSVSAWLAGKHPERINRVRINEFGRLVRALRQVVKAGERVRGGSSRRQVSAARRRCRCSSGVKREGFHLVSPGPKSVQRFHNFASSAKHRGLSSGKAKGSQRPKALLAVRQVCGESKRPH